MPSIVTTQKDKLFTATTDTGKTAEGPTAAQAAQKAAKAAGFTGKFCSGTYGDALVFLPRHYWPDANIAAGPSFTI